MINIIKLIIANVLTALYQTFWFALILSVLFMFVWKEYGGVKEAAKIWVGWLKTEPKFRKMLNIMVRQSRQSGWRSL